MWAAKHATGSSGPRSAAESWALAIASHSCCALIVTRPAVVAFLRLPRVFVSP